jgi:hypothetical protein
MGTVYVKARSFGSQTWLAPWNGLQLKAIRISGLEMEALHSLSTLTGKA